MFKRYSQHGAASMGEYIITFFLVTAALIAIGLYMQRSVQGRMADARHYLIKTVSSECDKACLEATNSHSNITIAEQYEPYYINTATDTKTQSVSHTGLLAPGIGNPGIFIGRSVSNTTSSTDASQAPPQAARNDVMLYGDRK